MSTTLDQLIDDLGGIGMVLLMILIIIVIMTFALSVGVNAVKGENTSLAEIFTTGVLMIALFLIITFGIRLAAPQYALIGSIVAFIIGLFILQARHDTTLFGAFGAICIYIVVLIIIVFLLGLIFGGELTSYWNIIYSP